MTNFNVAIYNPTSKKLGVPQGADGYNFPKPVHLEGALTTDGLVDGRDVAADGTKLDLFTIVGTVDIDTRMAQLDALQTKQDLLTLTAPADLDSMSAKLAHISVSQAVDLDSLETRVNALDAAVVLMGTWDPSTGLFPVSTKAGESWIASAAGTVGSTPFAVNDRVVALVDGASTAIYNGNWHKLDYTDEVLSVAGKTGAVVLLEADITDLQGYLLPTDIDTLGKLNTIVGESLLTVETLATTPFASVQYTPGVAPAWSEGLTFYDNVRKTLNYYTDDPDVVMNIGEENWIHVRNDTGSTIINGTAVYISGASGGIPQISKVIANSERCIGVATHDIETGTVGHVTTHGTVGGVDLSSFSPGDTLWVSPTVAGALVNTQPDWPDSSIEIGIVLDNAISGVLLVDIEHHGNADVLNKSYNFSSRTASSGTYFLGGFYEAPAVAANLTQAAPTVVLGTANSPYEAHAFMVFGAGSTDGTTITITVSGTSWTDAGVRTPGDSEILYSGPVAGLTVNDMLESIKKWIGQVTYTLTSDGTTFTCDFNYGLAKYEDFHNFDFTLRAFEFVGLCDTSDAGFNIEVLHHNDQGWTYAATGFVPGNTALYGMNSEHGVEQDAKAGEHFAFKHSNVNTFVEGIALEGLIVRVVTSINNSIAYLNGHVTVTT